MAQTLRSSIKGALNRSIKGSLLSPAQFRGSTLDLDFAGAKSLKNQIGKEDVVSFTRASSSGTYVGSDGLIKTAVTNLIKYSEKLNEATAWSYGGIQAFGSGSVVDAIAAPNGTLSADKITEDTSTGSHEISPVTGVVFDVGRQYIVSAFLKRGERDTALITAHPAPFPGAIGGRTCYADLSTGEFFLGSSYDAGDIIDVGNDWYRVWAAITADATTAGDFNLGIAEDVNVLSYTGDGTSGIYLWGAQLEASSTVGEYIPTTSTINSAPRFDHDPTTGESLGLLVEESRVNYFEWSNSAVDGETWNNVGTQLDLTSGQADPAGGTTAIRASDANNDTGGTTLQRTNLASLTTGATISYSIWLKPISCPNDLLTLIVYANGTTDYISAPFPVSGGQITGMGIVNASGTGVAINSSVTPYPNGWYRCVLTGIPSTVTMTDVRTRVILGSYQRVQGTARFDWYGAQLEEGSFPTSYIPTTGSTVTRSADVVSIEGANFSSWYRQDEGSAFVDFTINGVNTGNNFIYDFSNGTIDEEIFLNYLSPSGAARWVARIAGVQTTQDQNGAGLPRFKHAFGMASNNYMVARDGILSTGSSQVGMPSNTSLRLGARFNDFAASNGTIRRLVYWGQRLPNSTLQAITQ